MKKVSYIWFIFFFINFSFLFAQWENDVRLTFADGHSNTSSNNARCIATQGDTIHVVWCDERDGNTEIYYKRSLDRGTNWERDVRLTDDPAGSGLPTVAVSGLNVHVAWFDVRAGFNNFEIYYKRSTDGGTTWGPDTRLTFDPLISWYPCVGLTNSNVHVVWRETRDGNYEIFYKRSTDEGTTWGPDTNLSNASGSSETPCITVSSTTLHVLWFDNQDGGQYEIYYKRSTDEGVTWEPDVRLTDDPAVSFGPCVAVSGSNVHVVWQDTRDGSGWELYYKNSTDGGTTWGQDRRLTNAPETSEAPSVVASGSNVHVVWWDNRDGNYEIYYKCSFDNGTTWEPDTRLTNDDSWSQNPHIAFADTMLHVVWLDGRVALGNNEIFYKRNPTGNTGVGENTALLLRKDVFLVPTIFRNDIEIRFIQSSKRDIKLTIYNIYGTPLFEKSYSCTPQSLTINDKIINQLPPAIYFLSVSLEDGKQSIVKLIKL